MPQMPRSPAPVLEVSAAPQAPTPSETTVTPVAEPVPVRPVVVVPPPVRAPIAPQVPALAVVTPVAAPTPAPVPSVPLPIVEPPAPATAARLERIRVIKSNVNNRVGNPVNLVALDKTIGSEYMSSLLEAMKLLSSASDVESERAMARLEVAYTAVDTLLKGTIAPAVAPAAPSVVMSPVLPLTSDNVSAVAQSSWSQPESVPSVATIPQRPVAAIPTAPRMSSVASTPIPQVPQPMIQSVAASQVPLRSIAELPTADEVNSASVTGDPLFTKEVDSGLQQLLSEWSLFKKSGLFGTGPSGREHPLFLKMAPLALPLLLAGRFEGSTQETKQSVTDYMNGWRYEQGIVYEKDETFEHYLRRVIRHIIDLQNKKRGA